MMAKNLDGGTTTLGITEPQVFKDPNSQSTPQVLTVERGFAPPGPDDDARYGTTSSAYIDQSKTHQDSSIQSAGTVEEFSIGTRRRLRLPSIRADRETREYLRGEMAKVAVGVEGLIRNAIQRSGTEVDAVDASVRRYQDRSRTEVKFTVRTRLNPEQAFALWDEIGKNIDDWMGRLNPRAQRILDEQVGISVEWVEWDAG